MNSEQSPQLEVITVTKQSPGRKFSFLMPKKQQLSSWQLLIAAALLLGGGFWTGQQFKLQEAKPVSQENVQQSNILPVTTEVVQEPQSYLVEQFYTGEVTAVRASAVGFERNGKLIEVLVEEGARVEPDAPLARLDVANLQAQRLGLLAQQERAQAVLAELSNGDRPEQVAAAQARVRDLEQQLELERLKSSRREYLYGEGAIAKEALDEISFNQKALGERLTDAQSNLDELKNGTRVEQISAQQAVIKNLTAQIQDLDITISKSTLKAPFAGTVAQRNLDEGTVVQAGTSILRLVEEAQPKVKIGIPVAVAQKIQPGSRQSVMIAGQEYRAEVSSILPEVNPATRTRTLVLRLPPKAMNQVAPGQIARLKVAQTSDVEGYWLPITALIKGDRGLWSGYAVSETKDGQLQTERRHLELLETQGDRVLVRGTIQPGDRIVTEGTHRLVPGQVVKLSQNS